MTCLFFVKNWQHFLSELFLAIFFLFCLLWKALPNVTMQHRGHIIRLRRKMNFFGTILARFMEIGQRDILGGQLMALRAIKNHSYCILNKHNIPFSSSQAIIFWYYYTYFVPLYLLHEYISTIKNYQNTVESD